VIELYVYEARTYFSGKESELEVMFGALRVKDKNGFWRAKSALRRLAYANISDEDREEQEEKIKEEAKYIKFYERRSDSFGTGLLSKVRKHLKKHGIRFKIKNERKPVLQFQPIKKLHFVDKVEDRPEQVEMVNAALLKGRGIIYAATNAGKTEVASGIISELYRQNSSKRNPRSVLFFVHRVGLVEQSVDRFRKHLGPNIHVENLKHVSRRLRSYRGVVVASTQTASGLVGKKNKDFLSFLETCDMVFVDEFHINKAWAASRIMNKCLAPMRFGMSGTIAEHNKVKLMHYTGMTGSVIAEIHNKELVELGRSAKPIIRLIKLEGEELDTTGFGESYRLGIEKNVGRNKIVVREAGRYVNRGWRTMITVARIAHGIRLKRFLAHRYPDMTTEFISGSTPLPVRKDVKDRFTRGKIPVLIASPIFDVGEDLPAIDAWVNAAGGKGWELVLQRLGRVLRKKKGENKVRITDFLDLFDRYLKKHSIARARYYVREKIADIKIIRREL
jgi:superfamily II DNA or RNA helicase